MLRVLLNLFYRQLNTVCRVKLCQNEQASGITFHLLHTHKIRLDVQNSQREGTRAENVPNSI